MFFYETFGASGVPKGLVDILLRSFEEQLGVGFSHWDSPPIRIPPSTIRWAWRLRKMAARFRLPVPVVTLPNSTMVGIPWVRPITSMNTDSITWCLPFFRPL